ncbi:MAG: hypothetical protein LQ350_000412 [Teloschistes chrysophthalmus]|nr:MAG: hypothetical protein LQ350_000412 [Niorma chrysophthalma]
MCCSTDILLALLAIIFPPLAVWIKSGICSADSLINILLSCLGFFPGLLHAWYIIAAHPDNDDPSSDGYTDLEHGQHHQQGHVTYYYVNDSRNNSVSGPVPQGYPSQQRAYGTVQGMGVPPQPQPPPQGQQGQQGGPSGQGSSQQGEGVPPTYEQAIAGDNKVQK